MAKYEETITITEALDEQTRHILEDEPEGIDACFGENEPNIAVTAEFANGWFADLKCCGVAYEEGGSNTGWSEAVLFDDGGCEACCSEVEDHFAGDWELECDGDEYVIHVVVDGA